MGAPPPTTSRTHTRTHPSTPSMWAPIGWRRRWAKDRQVSQGRGRRGGGAGAGAEAGLRRSEGSGRPPGPPVPRRRGAWGAGGLVPTREGGGSRTRGPGGGRRRPGPRGRDGGWRGRALRAGRPGAGAEPLGAAEPQAGHAAAAPRPGSRRAPHCPPARGPRGTGGRPGRRRLRDPPAPSGPGAGRRADARGSPPAGPAGLLRCCCEPLATGHGAFLPGGGALNTCVLGTGQGVPETGLGRRGEGERQTSGPSDEGVKVLLT